MARGRPSLRLLAALLLAALPPIAVLAASDVLLPSWLANAGSGAVLVGAVAATVLWAGLVTLLAARSLAGEARSMVTIAERGVSRERAAERPTADDGLSGVQRRLVSTLEERNRQISDLAALVRSAPISDDAGAVACAMVAGARQATGDPTWILAVLRVHDGGELRPGVYGPDPDAPREVLADVHLWASTAGLADGSDPGARLVSGPWGAFTVIDVAAGDELRATLLAPWEGRPDPSPADLNLFGLIGQHASTAIEHALLYARVRTQTDELNRMAAVQTDFLRGITHDLQTPLTSIRVLASELQGSEVVDAAARIDLETIAHQADRLRRMVGQLLAVSRLEVGELTPQQEVFRAAPLVRRTWDALRDTGHGFALEESGPRHLVVADPDRLEQVLWALMDNAVKYSPRGSAVTVRIESHATTTGDGLVSEISISDAGAGMDAATAGRAFEQFFRADEARRLVPDGSGIGLYAARGLVEAMGGQIRVVSEPGQGTSMIMTLPAERADDATDDDPDKLVVGADGVTKVLS
ncbi:MAG: HAMP domain-containing histidine kinase [Chloroflexota bacterium]|nr:HAMP domain-containing histidine kinase [Chloroflexota bacterium]